MKHIIVICLCFLGSINIFSQEKSIYKLNPIQEGFLTLEVKEIIAKGVEGDKVVFLGESDHQYGSDIRAKGEVAKYLIEELGYTDIIFEADFFALLLNSSARYSLYKMWSVSDQNEDFMNYLKQNKVNYYGLDVRFATTYSRDNFTVKLKEYLSSLDINLEERFVKLTNECIVTNGYKNANKLTSEDYEYLTNYVDKLLHNETVTQRAEWKQILESYKSAVILYFEKAKDKNFNINTIRDKQMASNIDFLVHYYPEKKFIVWLANAHMSKINESSHNCGYEFVKRNPNKSYHIAIASYGHYYQTDSKIYKAFKDNKNLLSLLPSVDSNYFLDVNELVNTYLEYKANIYGNHSKDTIKPNDRLFQVSWNNNKSSVFMNFDAMIFLKEKEEITYDQYNKLLIEKKKKGN
ncbi:erythromycin esterase family protein [Myroides marinus]|uniref:erythromycin esterase family protein n=1 Tax=Myroides marinus TaxID=703342 RepID=UPI002576BC32|nr:erythromycin esterase family protein [Myroides marinus]MDM1373602.1 erythromycin esterase family protein [Myroides marinus]